MNIKAKVFFASLPLVGPLAFVCLYKLCNLNWETSAGLVVVGMSTAKLLIVLLPYTANVGEARNLLRHYALVTLFLGLAVTANGLWGARWTFLGWAVGIAVVLQYVALKLMVKKFRLLAKTNTVARREVA